MPDSSPDRSPQRSSNRRPPEGSSETVPILPSPRPYSTPDASVSSYPCPSSPTMASNRHSSASLSASTPQIPFYTLPRVSSNAPFSGPPSEPDSTSPFCHPRPSSRTTDRPITREPAGSIRSPSTDSSSSSSNTDSSSSTSNTSQASSEPPDKHSSTSHHTDSFSSHNSQPRLDSSESLPRPVSPFRAPQPPLHHQSSRSLLYQPTAIQSYMVPLQDTSSYPPPDPPVILPIENHTQSSFRSQPPYFPFLSHAPPPENSWIRVETLQHEYRLHARLPGFTREGITLATKRRRILHVVADKWENGGGHFERRISFGYDADLVQVRADFDGLMLRIMVPRRISPISLHTTSPAAVGRT